MARQPRIVLGVCGGIAAYKAVELCRHLVDAGALVAPVMTEDATRFLGPATLSALASEPVHLSLWDDDDPIPHTRLGKWADLVVVAPATARLIGAYAGGICDDLLTATLLATRVPVVVCPAMHTEMWEHPAVQDNVATLRSRAVRIVDPGTGRLAGGDEGPGRLADLAEIISVVESTPLSAGDLSPPDMVGLRVLVTAGGTREPLDPVRFIGNRSSGKQGHALADEAASRGAEVTLVTTTERAVHPRVDVVHVETAEEMEQAVQAIAPDADVVVMAAAVADFRPKAVAGRKLKRVDGVPDVLLEPTPDILAGLGERKRAGQVLVGFAAETHEMGSPNLHEEAVAKLRRKRLDLLVANDVLASGAGFEHDTNAVLLIDAAGHERSVPLTDKREVARLVLDAVVQLAAERGGHHRDLHTKGRPA